MPGSFLPTWLWLWAPLLFLLVVPVLLVFYPEQAQDLIGEENGIVELATVLVLVPAVMFGFYCQS
ncbi:MAG: hypothetical protein ACRESK_09620, partial [Gammaproteobacteria bacterium]